MPPSATTRPAYAPPPDNALGLDLDALRTAHRKKSTPVAEDLELIGTHTRETAAVVGELVHELIELLDRLPADEAARTYVARQTAEHNRVAAAMTEAARLHVPLGRRVVLKTNRHSRIPTTLELGAIRMCSRRYPERATIVALTEAGAAPVQIAELDRQTAEIRDERLHVQLPAGRGVLQRTVTLPTWVSRTAARVLLDDDQLRGQWPRRRDTDGNASSEVTRKAVHEAQSRAAAVAGVPITPEGLRLSRAAETLQAEGLPGVQDLLGTTTLSSAQRLLHKYGITA